MGSVKECSVQLSIFICNRIPSKLLTASRQNFAINSGFLLDETTSRQIRYCKNLSIQLCILKPNGFSLSCLSKCHTNLGPSATYPLWFNLLCFLNLPLSGSSCLTICLTWALLPHFQKVNLQQLQIQRTYHLVQLLVGAFSSLSP